MAADRDILFGILALQVGLIDQSDWSLPSRPGRWTSRGRWRSTSSAAATSMPSSVPESRPWWRYT